MKAQASCEIARVLGPDQRRRIVVKDVVEPRQDEAQRRAAGQRRHRLDFCGAERAMLAIGGEQLCALCDVEAAIGVEAPGIQQDRQIVSECIVAGEVEVDGTRDRS